MKKIMSYFIVIAITIFINQNISFANWKHAYTDKWGDFSFEEESAILLEDNSGFYADLWMKQDLSAASIDDLANASGDNKEYVNLAYNIKSIVSHVQIRQSKWEYRSLKRIIYDKNNKVVLASNNVESWHSFTKTSAIHAISQEFIISYIKKMEQEKKQK